MFEKKRLIKRKDDQDDDERKLHPDYQKNINYWDLYLPQIPKYEYVEWKKISHGNQATHVQVSFQVPLSLGINAPNYSTPIEFNQKHADFKGEIEQGIKIYGQFSQKAHRSLLTKQNLEKVQ